MNGWVVGAMERLRSISEWLGGSVFLISRCATFVHAFEANPGGVHNSQESAPKTSIYSGEVHNVATTAPVKGSENSFREIAGLFRMAPRGHVQTLTPRTWERRRASCRCVRRGKCRSMRMRVLETERFVRQLVLGANIHETEGLLERSIALNFHQIRIWCKWKSPSNSPRHLES